MRRTALALLAVGTLLALCASGALAGPNMLKVSPVPLPDSFFPAAREFEHERADTIWFFVADFNNTTGDNAWWSVDVSGQVAETNYWHLDTIRTNWIVNSVDVLGDWAWWCGKYDVCWLQPRGYGNLWTQYLWRDFTPQMVGVSNGALIQLTFNQRYALERAYDYGYVDVGTIVGGVADWDTTVAFYTNPGFAGKPGTSQNWAANGEKVIDLSSYYSPNLAVRFRMQSSYQNSSQDQYNNPPQNSYKDGAWQLDNFKFKVNGATIWSDNCESGEGTWQHPNIEAEGQTGVVFWRGIYGTDFWTNRDFTCGAGTGWMWAAVEPVESRMVDDQWTYLVSPPINTAGVTKIASRWTMWVDLPYESGDRFDLNLAADDQPDCVQRMDAFQDESPGGWYGGPFWGTWNDNWDAFSGHNYLAIRWELANDSTPTVPHMGGIFLAKQKVGEPTGAVVTTYNRDTWYSFNDWCNDQLSQALLDSSRIEVKDPDGILSVRLIASNNAGQTWQTFNMNRETPEGNWWGIKAPASITVPGANIRYYYSATDGVGTVSKLPSTAPDSYYTYKLLPSRLPATYNDILLVDKHGRRVPGEYRRRYYRTSEYYYREALGILGYEYDVYDVEVPSGTTVQSNGPDSSMYKYYNTQIWWFADFDAFTIKRVDQKRLIDWLSVASPTKDRNLLISGNDVGMELMATGKETLGFYETWLASDYVQDFIGPVNVDSVPGLIDKAGGWNFMTVDPVLGTDGQAILAGACPILHYFDVVDAMPGVAGAEVVADYIKADCTTRLPSGCAYTHPTLGYQTVNLGFDICYVMDGQVCGGSNYTPAGHFKTGIRDRANLIKNIMLYFQKNPTQNPTGVEGGLRNELSQAYPNPFNPVTKIAYSIREAGPVRIEIYNIAGRVVRTLLDTEVAAGTQDFVVWDGTDDVGAKCASGVYFYRLNAPGYTQTEKMVMLK